MRKRPREARGREGDRGVAASESVGLHPSADLWGLPMLGYLSVA